MFNDFKYYIRLYSQLKKCVSAQEKTVFWGASIFLKNYLRIFGKPKCVIGIIDKDSQKWGTTYCGYKVYSPDDLNKIKPENIIFTIKHNHSKIYTAVEAFIDKNYPTIGLFPNIFEPDRIYKKRGIYVQKIYKALNKKKKARLFIDTGLISLINTMSIIKNLDNKNYDNYLLIYSETVSEEFRKFCSKLIDKKYFKKIFFIDAESLDTSYRYLKNSGFLRRFESVYTSAQPWLTIWQRHTNINLIEEGVSSYIIFEDMDYSNVQNIYTSNYLKNHIFLPPYEHQSLLQIEKNNIKKTIQEIRKRNKIDYSFLKSENQVLMLSQYLYSNFMSIEEQFEFYKKHIDKLLESGFSILFKTHPRVNDKLVLKLESAYKNNSKFKIFPENIKYPVELIIDDLDLRALVTSMSGGAFNCTYLFGIPSYGFGAKLALEKHWSKNIKTYAKVFLENMPHISELYKIKG